MTNPGGRTARCYVRVCRIESTDVNPRGSDFFTFYVTATLRCLSNYYSRRRIRNTFPLFESSIRINCKSFFFHDNTDFLQRYLPYLQHSPFFTPESIDQITQRMITLVQRLFDVESLRSDVLGSADSEQQELPMALDIVVDVQVDEESEEMEGTLMEEPMEQYVPMIPASNEAIQSLKTFNLPQKCNICMDTFHIEEDDDKDVKLSSMPCGHVFHHHCIVKWLQTSHMCPLCRYPMPTNKDNSLI